MTPQAGQTGTSTINLTTADDTGLTATTNLTVTVVYAPEVTFPDPNLEAAVRNSLNRPTGPITTYDLLSLTSLNTGWPGTNAPITNLAGLEWATNLTALYLSGNAITSLSPLRALPQLQTLDIGYNTLRDPSVLQGLTNLTTLTLNGNTVTDLSPLAGLPNLTSLSVSSCSLSNLTGIGALAHLQSITLGYNGLCDPSPLAILTNLTYVELEGNPLAGTAGLAGLSQVVNLDLASCSLSDLGGLRGLTNLQTLTLFDNLIRDLSPLAGLTNLTFLALDSNPLTSLAALGGLSRLATLTLADCHLASLASLPGLTALQFLYLPNNRIRDLAPLAGLTNLTTLYLTGNSPTNLAPLGALPALNTLDLSSCSLSNVSSLAPLTHLQSLSLAYDRITDISALSGLTNLYSLYLTANRLTNIDVLQTLTGLKGVELTRNLLDLSTGSAAMTVITNLQTTSYWVSYDPQNQPPVFYNLRTNWVIRPNAPADLQFALVDDVTSADKVAVTVACSSAGPLSNSAVTFVRTSFVLSSGLGTLLPGPPITVLPPIVIQPPVIVAPPIILPPLPPPPIITSPPIIISPPIPILPALPVTGLAASKSSLRPPFQFPPYPYGYGGGESFWDLTLTPAPNQTGTMTLTLTATDDTGLTTNATILVTVAPPQGLDGALLDTTNLLWQTGGNAPWFGQTNVSHSGSSAAQAGPVGVNEETWLETTVTGPGILTFWWKLGTAIYAGGAYGTYGYGSYVSFTTSRGGGLYLQGNNDWQKATVSIPAGECVLDWSQVGFWTASPSDGCWVDQVGFVPTMPDFWVEAGFSPGAGGSWAMVHGEPGGLYEFQVSTNLANWSPLSTVVVDPAQDGFTAWAADPAAPGGPRFYRARQSPASTMWFGPVTLDTGGSPVLQLYCQPGTVCEILASTNLLTWSALATVTNTTGTALFTDTQKDLAKRFYKARQLP